jgi:hypothetical protein
MRWNAAFASREDALLTDPHQFAIVHHGPVDDDRSNRATMPRS